MYAYSWVIFYFSFYFTYQYQPKLTIDEFFNATSFESLSLSPNGEHVLIFTRRPSWDTDSFETSLWLYETRGARKQLITNKFSELLPPKWSPSGNLFLYAIKDKKKQTNSLDKNEKLQQSIQIYNVLSDDVFLLEIGSEMPSALTWSDDESVMYFAAKSSSENKSNHRSDGEEWKDVIDYRQSLVNDHSIIYRVDIIKKNKKQTVKINFIKKLDFIVDELVFASVFHKLICKSVSAIVENPSTIEIYSIDLDNAATLTKLTDNEELEQNLRLSKDGRQLFFLLYPIGSKYGTSNMTQSRLFSIDLKTGNIERWGKDFTGNIRGYVIRSEGGVHILGHLGTNMQIYSQYQPSKNLIFERCWNGTYRLISASSSKRYSSIVFAHSSFERPEEIYFIDHIDQLRYPRALTNENELFKNRNLPRAKLYRWKNDDDGRVIEGILHYPPDQFEHKNLPLLVLIHGGPTDASLNILQPDWYSWAPLAATEGWLVLEPNYRGSTGYGDEFVNEIRTNLVSRPGKDILDGVISLVHDGIADPTQLNIGGYSYGGFLTNWLITQTTRFNAAISGAGGVDHASMWGTTDVPVYVLPMLGGYPWETPEIYFNESAIYHLDRVRTPTHIVTGAEDVRVPASQSYMLERGLHYLNIPSQLLIFPGEGHGISINPWHGKIKVQQELKWLEKYGHLSWAKTRKL